MAGSVTETFRDENGEWHFPVTMWPRRYPFMQMEVGDYFFVKSIDHKPSDLDAMVRYYNRKRERVFKSSRDFGGVRVWRVD